MLRCYFCAQALGFEEFCSCRDATFVHRRLGFKRFDATFVHRRLGFKRFLFVAMLLLCTGAWVLSEFDASLK